MRTSAFIITSIAISFGALVSSCGTSKKVHDARTTDSTVIEQKADVSSEKTVYVRDTVIQIDTRVIHDTINTIVPINPVTAKKVPIHSSKRMDGLYLWANIDTNGLLTYGCQADSLLMVINNLRTELQVTKSKETSQVVSKKTEKVIKTKKKNNSIALVVMIIGGAALIIRLVTLTPTVITITKIFNWLWKLLK